MSFKGKKKRELKGYLGNTGFTIVMKIYDEMTL
jgi:hypothetical protein